MTSSPTNGPTVVVLPGPPRELQPMWDAAVQTEAMRQAIAGATVYEQRTMRLFGIPESEIAQTLREAEGQGIELGRLEVTTCLKRGEVEIVTRYEPDAGGVYEAFERVVRERHADTLFSPDGSTVDEQVAGMLRGDGSRSPWTIAVAESCTGGELAARLTGPAGASEYVAGGVVVYSNEAKTRARGRRSGADRGARCGVRTGRACARRGRARAYGSPTWAWASRAWRARAVAPRRKPVGLVWLSVAGPKGESITRSVNLPGGRADIRDRTTTVALHLVRRLLLGEADG